METISENIFLKSAMTEMQWLELEVIELPMHAYSCCSDLWRSL